MTNYVRFHCKYNVFIVDARTDLYSHREPMYTAVTLDKNVRINAISGARAYVR